MAEVIEMSNHFHHLSEYLGRRKKVMISKSGKVGVALLMKILVIYLIFVPGVFLIECSAAALSDEKPSVSISGLSQITDSGDIGDTIGAFSARHNKDLIVDKGLEVRPGTSLQLKSVSQDAGIKASGEADNTEADTDEEFDIWHIASEYFLCFAIGFLAGYIPPFDKILKNYRKRKEQDRQFEENWPEWRRQIQENYEEQQRLIQEQKQEKQNG